MPGFLTLCYMVLCRFPRSCVPTTSSSISPRMDLWASITFCSVFTAGYFVCRAHVIQSQVIFICTYFMRLWCLCKNLADVSQDACSLTLCSMHCCVGVPPYWQWCYQGRLASANRRPAPDSGILKACKVIDCVYLSTKCMELWNSEEWFRTVLRYHWLLLVFCLMYLLQLKDGFGEGKDLVVTVMAAMGEEQICALKDIGPKN